MICGLTSRIVLQWTENAHRENHAAMTNVVNHGRIDPQPFTDWFVISC